MNLPGMLSGVFVEMLPTEEQKAAEAWGERCIHQINSRCTVKLAQDAAPKGDART